MQIQDGAVLLYSSQRNAVIEKLLQTGVHYAKMAYIRNKYGDVSRVFTNAYEWFATAAPRIVPKPEAAESGIWVFPDEKLLERDDESAVLRLRVPLSEVIFFKISDWNKVLNCQYIGIDSAEERRFKDEAYQYGVRNIADICTTAFYPQLKQELTQSWTRLFRFHDEIKAGIASGQNFDETDLQGALWQLKAEWLAEE